MKGFENHIYYIEDPIYGHMLRTDFLMPRKARSGEMSRNNSYGLCGPPRHP